MLVTSGRLIVDSLVRHAIAWTLEMRQRNILTVVRVERDCCRRTLEFYLRLNKEMYWLLPEFGTAVLRVVA